MNELKIIGAKIITQSGLLNGEVCISGGTISYVGERQKHTDVLYQMIDADGFYLSPGFIDLHVHGGGGSDFMDATAEAFLTAAYTHTSHGTTTLYPTTVACADERLLACMDAFEQVPQTKGIACMPGLHLEGPYLAKSQKGAIDERYIIEPKKEHYERILMRADLIKRWSIAPELEGALELGALLQSKGIITSIAHTEAMYEDVVRALKSGFGLVTHLYSAMSSLKRIDVYRRLGVIECVYLLDELSAEIIADGHHLPPELLRLIVKNISKNRLALITDAMRAAGTDCNESILGAKDDGLPVIVENGVAKLLDRTAFAGSVATADLLVRNMIELAGVNMVDAVGMITETPARIMGLKDRGIIDAGYRADLLLFDENVYIHKVMVNGELIT